jgi:hypothetical protein
MQYTMIMIHIVPCIVFKKKYESNKKSIVLMKIVSFFVFEDFSVIYFKSNDIIFCTKKPRKILRDIYMTCINSKMNNEMINEQKIKERVCIYRQIRGGVRMAKQFFCNSNK